MQGRQKRNWRARITVPLLMMALGLCCGGSTSATAKELSLERFLYFTTDDKIVVDLRFNEPTDYVLDYMETANLISIELPEVAGFEQFCTTEEVNDSVLHRVRLEPIAATAVQGLRVILELRHKVPAPLAFHVSGRRRLLVEIKKEFRAGFETFVAPGIVYGHWRKDTEEGPLFVNYMKVDLQQPGVEVGPRLADAGKEAVHQIAGRHGAIAAINGIYFAADGSPLGMIMIDGDMVSPPYMNRTALGIKTDGSLIIDNVGTIGEVQRLSRPSTTSVEACRAIDGINRRRLTDELIVYTPDQGAHTGTNDYGWEAVVEGDRVVGFAQGNAPIPPAGYVLSGHGLGAEWLQGLDSGEPILATWSLVPDWPHEGVIHALGGGPRLLKDGQVEITAQAEQFQADVAEGRAPRTALGITAAGELLLATINGRQSKISIGMTLSETAELLLELGAVDAMNLDGGGSSTMVVRGVVLNAPSDGRPRSVSNALLVWADGGSY